MSKKVLMNKEREIQDVKSKGIGSVSTAPPKRPRRKGKGRKKIPIKFIERRNGLLKKSYELSVLTGSELVCIISSPQSSNVYSFASSRFSPLVELDSGKLLIQSLLTMKDVKTDPNCKLVNEVNRMIDDLQPHHPPPMPMPIYREKMVKEQQQQQHPQYPPPPQYQPMTSGSDGMQYNPHQQMHSGMVQQNVTYPPKFPQVPEPPTATFPGIDTIAHGFPRVPHVQPPFKDDAENQMDISTEKDEEEEDGGSIISLNDHHHHQPLPSVSDVMTTENPIQV